MLRFIIVLLCVLSSLPLAIAEPPQESDIALPNVPAAPHPSSSDRYQMIALEKTVLLLDKSSGDTWQLVTEKNAKPRWASLTRHDEQPIAAATPERPIAAATPERKGQPKAQAPAQQKTDAKQAPLAGPIDFTLIPNHDIVIMRGPESTIRAAKEAIDAMNRIHSGDIHSGDPSK